MLVKATCPASPSCLLGPSPISFLTPAPLQGQLPSKCWQNEGLWAQQVPSTLPGGGLGAEGLRCWSGTCCSLCRGVREPGWASPSPHWRT